MLSLEELAEVNKALEPLVVGSRLQRIVQADEYNLFLELYGWDESDESATKRTLHLCCHPQFARVELLPEPPKAPPWPPDFTAMLKKHAGRLRLSGMRLLNEDRLLSLLLQGKQGGLEIVLALMGPRSNLYALDLDGKLLGAMRPLASTRHELHVGQPWTNPENRSDGAGRNRWPGLGGQQLLDAVQAHYTAAESAAQAEHLRHNLHSALKRELDFAVRKEGNLQRDLEAAKLARENKHLGELLKSVMAQIQPGDKSVTAQDFETGVEVEIPLDPALSAAENLEKFFKSYHKGLIGTNMLGQQLDITRSHVADLREMMAGLEAATDAQSLHEFAQTPAVQSLLRRHFPEEDKPPARPPKKKAEKKDVPSRLLPRRYLTSDGLEVWVGRNDDGNDYLTTRLAAGNDLFFHVEGYPGSHTILHVNGKSDPPPESVLEACELAVHFSKMKDATKATLHVAPIKHVHKPKGAKPGLVYVNKGKAIQLRRDKKRLERILGALIK